MIAGVRVALCSLLATLAAACTADPCTEVIDRFTGAPQPTFECPSGQVCYQGACVASCNAGAERSEVCDTDDDCASSARPTCIDKRCSACVDDQVCIPVTNVCSSVIILASDGGQRDANVPAYNPPQDGGWVDGSVFSRDSGVQQMQSEVPPSHVGSIRLNQITRHLPMRRTESAVDITALDIRGRGRVKSSTATRPFSDVTYRCDILSRVTYASTPTTANIGDIRIVNSDENIPGVVGAPYVAKFEDRLGRYVLDNPIPTDFLAFSSTVPPARLGYVDVLSTGQTMVGINGWPARAESYHVVYQLSPTSAVRPETGQLENTPALLRSGTVVENPAASGIPFRWNSPQLFPGVTVRVRVDGPSYDLECVADEGAERVFVISRMLDAFRSLNQLPANDVRDLSFERVFRKRIEVPSAIEMGIKVELDLEIRHAHVTQITFR